MSSVLPPPMGCSRHCQTLCPCLSHFSPPVPAWSIPRAGIVSPGDIPVPTLFGVSRDHCGGCSSGFLEMIFSVISTWCNGGEVGKVAQGTGSGQSPPAVVWDGWGWLQWGVQSLCTKGTRGVPRSSHLQHHGTHCHSCHVQEKPRGVGAHSSPTTPFRRPHFPQPA